MIAIGLHVHSLEHWTALQRSQQWNTRLAIGLAVAAGDGSEASLLQGRALETAIIEPETMCSPCS